MKYTKGGLAIYRIYSIADPRTGLIRYVGLSSNVDQRKRFHMSAKRGTPMGDWMEELANLGLRRVFAIIGKAEGSWAFEVERKEIAKARNIAGHLLINKQRKSRWNRSTDQESASIDASPSEAATGVQQTDRATASTLGA